MGIDEKVISHLLLVIVVLTWGANFGILKSAFQDLPPIPFAAMRFAISGILLLAIAYWREKELGIRKEDLAGIAMVGALGIGVCQILWSTGLDLTSASNSALILSLQPLLAALYVGLTKREPVGRQQYWNMLLAFGGVILVILKPTASLHFSMTTLLGDLLTLLAAICATLFFSISSKPLLNVYSPLRLMGYCMVIGSLVLWIAVPFSNPHIVWDRIGAKAWWALGYAVVVSGMVGHVAWYEGIERLGVTRSMIYQFIIPIWAVIFNYFLMGEKVFFQQVVGGALILLAVHRALRN